MTADLELKPASNFSIPELADLLTRGFEGYIVPIHITEAALLTMLRRDSIDLFASRVLLKDEKPVGVGLIARRGWTSRLAAMGIVPEARNSGAGTFAMQRLLSEASERCDREMILEVIEQNTPAVKLYQNTGFNPVRRLVGFHLDMSQTRVTENDSDLKDIDIRDLAKLISAEGIQNLPWQLTGETIAHHTLPSHAFQLGDAYCLVSNPDADKVVIFSVLVKAGARRAGLGRRLMRAVFFRFPERSWHVPELFPEEMSPFFESLGMKRTEISQWQMAVRL